MSATSSKIVVITGAAGTLCSAIARDFAKDGARVALIGRTPEKVEALASELEAAGQAAIGIGGDVTSVSDMRTACETVRSNWGEADVLINGAGGKDQRAVTDKIRYTPEELEGKAYGFFNLDMEALTGEIELNTLGTIIPSQVFGAGMARKGAGSIVNFASMNSYRPLSRMPGYALAKAGVVNFTQWLADYLAPAGIRVNAVAPGFFVNERSRKLLLTPDGGFSERGKQVVAHTPAGRFGTAEEIVGAVRWLADDGKAAFVTGVCVPVDGGFLACSGL